jgi:hypothetical protein
MTAWGAIQDLNADRLISDSGKELFVIDMIMDNDRWLDFPAEIVDGKIVVLGVAWTPAEV